MEIIKENWKMVVFIILATLLLIKLDKLASTFNDLSLNGRFTKVSDEQEKKEIIHSQKHETLLKEKSTLV